jgi:ankyrin repeat protein
VQASDLDAAALLIRLGESPNLPADDGFPLLHTAIDVAHQKKYGTEERTRAMETVRFLIAHGAEPNVVGCDGTALHRAAGFGDEALVRLLVECGADVNARGVIDGEYTPLLHAIRMGHPIVIQILLENGADPELRTGYGMVEQPGLTPAQLAAARGDEVGRQIVRLLAEHK